MTLAENLQYFRTHQGLTQEQLAEQLNVSRQSVSKWESGASVPEMATLIMLCDLFHTDLDTLLRGSAEQFLAEDTAGYHRFMTLYARCVAGSVAAILGGVALIILLCNVLMLPEALGSAVLLLVIAAATVVLVATGIQHDHFRHRWPTITDFYTDAEREAFHQKFVWLISGGVGGILVNVALLSLFTYLLPEQEAFQSVAAVPFMLILAAAIYCLIYGGIMNDAYNIAKYNHANNLSPEEKAQQQRTNIVCGVIMLLATAFFLYQGFTRALWHTAWWVFPVGGVLCAVAGIVLGPRDMD